MNYCLCGCGEVLTGKQKKFFSEACRMRYNRRRKANANRPLLFANRSGFERQVEVKLLVKVVFRVNDSPQFDEMLLNKPDRRRLSQYLTAFLAEQYPRHQVLVVKVEKNR